MIASALDTLSRLDRSAGMARFRRRARHALAALVFGVECFALAGFWFLVLTFFVVRADPLATAHEWGSFLTHYVDAPPAARRPVLLVIVALLAALFGLVTWVRISAAGRAPSRSVEGS